MTSWQGISEFLAVVETASFTKAAQRLGTSTAHVSRQVAILEDRLNTRLFFRTTRRVSVTEEGDIYYQHCRMLADGIKEAESAVTQLRETPSGHIKLTAPVTYGEKMIMPLVLDFMQMHPDIQVDVDLTNTPLDLINSGCDFAIRLGRLNDSSMVCKRLATRKLIVCGSPDYLSINGTPHTLSELPQFNCLLGQHDYWRFRENGKERSVRVRGSLRCNSGLALLEAAVRDIGLIQLPDYYLDEALASGALVKVLNAYQDMEEGIWALFPHRRLQPLRVKLLVDFLADNLTEKSANTVKLVSA
ncbi:LysR family transcriptional regulator [Enterovibrio nigricans]|uniref:DNA-binding transcriptional regulator, LysR family n=1 Tax=Enterovibrio nigricans DSM 22720 TaxID=1121868 RepID=A0A1T4U2W4_9GAMM|nr:LysR family transcriptional regulator [Enterovibrio nigricans]PKF51794.1 LysR family transcriptional regulator [Enterovibrio nigricans]SKA46960.1 DNA-binding transcriptional regulator, LysR family [Enterovibrio nigricans DSM 22720]